MKDYYEILEVTHDASAEEIKNSYRRLALKYHPDKNNGNSSAEAKFKEIVLAYGVLSNLEEKRRYDNKYSRNNERRGTDNKSESFDEPLTPERILNLVSGLKNQVKNIDRTKVDQRHLFDSIEKILSQENLQILLNSPNKSINKKIALEVIECSKPLGNDKHPIQNFGYFERIQPKLIRLTASDKDVLHKISGFKRYGRLFSIWENYKGIVIISGIILLLLVWTNMFRSSAPTKKDAVRENGEFNESFNIDKKGQPLDQEDVFEQRKDSLLQNGWREEAINNGQLPICYNFTPQKSNLNNYLEIVVGGGTDVAIKLMNIETEKCVRYVFINSGTTYKIKNIPKGRYYLKIAYGKDWLSRVIDGQCLGKFTRNPIYEKGDEILDYNLKHDNDGYSIPSFRLSLDVISKGVSSSFDSEKISEDDFNL